MTDTAATSVHKEYVQESKFDIHPNRCPFLVPEHSL